MNFLDLGLLSKKVKYDKRDTKNVLRSRKFEIMRLIFNEGMCSIKSKSRKLHYPI